MANRGVMIATAGFAVAVLIIVAYVVGRSSAPRTVERPPKTPPRNVVKPPAENPVDPGPVRPPKPPTPNVNAPTDEQKAEARETLGGLADQLASAHDDEAVKKLNDLQQHLAASLADGRITGRDVLDRFQKETSPQVLDVMVAVLRNNPAAIDQDPALVDSFLSLAKGDNNENRRRAAVIFLSGISDPDGRARTALVETAQGAGSLNVRLAAVYSLRDYVRRNPDQGPAVQEEVIRIARSGDDVVLRAHALRAVNLYSASPNTVTDVAGMLKADSSADVRRAAAQALSTVGPAERKTALAGMQAAYDTEKERNLRGQYILNIVRLGRHESVPVLSALQESDRALQADIADYIEILKSGEVDMNRIQHLKRERERARR